MKFDITYTNNSNDDQELTLFESTNPDSKESAKYRFVLDYFAIYPQGTQNRILNGGNNANFTLDTDTTPTSLLDILNSLEIGTWELIASNAIDGNIYDVTSSFEVSEWEIDITPPVLQSQNTNTSGTEIEITFDKDMSDPTGKATQFSYKIDGNPASFSSASLKAGDDKTIVLDCVTTIEFGEEITISYVPGDISSTDTGLLEAFTDEVVSNTVPDTFSIGSGFDNTVNVVVEQSDGKILIGGLFTDYNGNTRNRILRLNADGTLDTSFSIGTGFDNTIKTIAIQSDGKLLVGGNFTDYNTNSRNRIVRLDSDGTLDTSFSIGTGFDAIVNTIIIQSDGKIVVAGNFTDYNGSTRNRIIRLDTNGSIDGGFSIGVGFNLQVKALAIQSDQKIIAVGSFLGYDSVPKNRIARLNTDGTLDVAFLSDSNNELFSIYIQSDGKIVIGGNFTVFNGVATNRIIRLETDGTTDSGFSVGTGFDAIVYSLALQSDNKILAGGAFTDYNSNSRNGIVRLDSDGTIDSGFSVGTGFNGISLSVIALSNARILTGGSFTTYNGTTYNRIIRLNTDGSSNTITT